MSSLSRPKRRTSFVACCSLSKSVKIHFVFFDNSYCKEKVNVWEAESSSCIHRIRGADKLTNWVLDWMRSLKNNSSHGHCLFLHSWSLPADVSNVEITREYSCTRFVISSLLRWDCFGELLSVIRRQDNWSLMFSSMHLSHWVTSQSAAVTSLTCGCELLSDKPRRQLTRQLQKH